MLCSCASSFWSFTALACAANAFFDGCERLEGSRGTATLWTWSCWGGGADSKSSDQWVESVLSSARGAGLEVEPLMAIVHFACFFLSRKWLRGLKDFFQPSGRWHCGGEHLRSCSCGHALWSRFRVSLVMSWYTVGWSCWHNVMVQVDRLFSFGVSLNSCFARHSWRYWVNDEMRLVTENLLQGPDRAKPRSEEWVRTLTKFTTVSIQLRH